MTDVENISVHISVHQGRFADSPLVIGGGIWPKGPPEPTVLSHEGNSVLSTAAPTLQGLGARERRGGYQLDVSGKTPTTLATNGARSMVAAKGKDIAREIKKQEKKTKKELVKDSTPDGLTQPGEIFLVRRRHL